MVRKRGRRSLKNQHDFETKRLFAYTELAGIEFWQNVMNIKNYFGSCKLWQECCEHEKIRYRVNMKQIIGLAEMADGKPPPRLEQKHAYALQERPPPFLFEGPHMNPEDSHAAD